jgi:hypothetical protein
MTRMLATLSIALLLTACGSDDKPIEESFPRSLSLGDNYQASFDMTAVVNGISDISISIESKDGSAIPDSEQVKISPVMEMVSGMTHGTPMLKNSGTLDDEGVFTTTAYFLMPSGPEMGDWYFTVEFNGEMETFSVDVDMLMSERQMLQGHIETDKIKDMNDNDVARPYFLFNEGRHITDSMNAFTVYVAARETMMKHTSLISDMTLAGEMAMTMEPMSTSFDSISSREMVMAGSDYDLVIPQDGIAIEMCIADCDGSGSWKEATATADKPGQYTAIGLGLTGSNSDIINVRLSINDEIKTKGDGVTYATFTFSEDSSDTGTMNHVM